jgi:glycerol-3-phosphate dehydrogenase
MEAAPLVATLMAEELGYDEDWVHGQVEAFREVAGGYILAS